MIITNFTANIIIWIADKLNPKFKIIAVTIWPFIFIAKLDQSYSDSDIKRLIKHERKHLEQWLRYWLIGFIIIYLYWHFRKGYWKNPLEIEARRAERE